MRVEEHRLAETEALGTGDTVAVVVVVTVLVPLGRTDRTHRVGERKRLRTAEQNALASDCAADGIYEMFLVSAPLNAPGGIGSPANAVAIK